jgi:hypothetical protein
MKTLKILKVFLGLKIKEFYNFFANFETKLSEQHSGAILIMIFLIIAAVSSIVIGVMIVAGDITNPPTLLVIYAWLIPAIIAAFIIIFFLKWLKDLIVSNWKEATDIVNEEQIKIVNKNKRNKK